MVAIAKIKECMKLIKDNEIISVDELKLMSVKMFESLVKAVVDIEKQVMIVDAEMHADQEEVLLEQGSEQYNLWGINLHPDFFGTDEFIEFDSMINIRSSQGNRSRSVESVATQKVIRLLVDKFVRNV